MLSLPSSSKPTDPLFPDTTLGRSAWAGLSGGPAALAGIATQFLTTFLCDDAEKQLDVKDRLSLCVSIGRYCSKSFLGVCSTKRKAYCCRSEEHTSELQSLMRISYAVFCLTQKTTIQKQKINR